MKYECNRVGFFAAPVGSMLDYPLFRKLPLRLLVLLGSVRCSLWVIMVRGWSLESDLSAGLCCKWWWYEEVSIDSLFTGVEIIDH